MRKSTFNEIRALRLQEELFKRWESANVPASKAFGVLGLDQSDIKGLTHVERDTLYGYITHLKSEGKGTEANRLSI